MGANCAATTRPSMRGSAVSISTSQDCAIRCIHVPTLDASAPAA